MISALQRNIGVGKRCILLEVGFSFRGSWISDGSGFERQTSGDIERESEDTFYFEREEATPNLVERVLLGTAPGGIGRKAVEEAYKGVVDPSNIKGYSVVPFVPQKVVKHLNGYFPYGYAQAKITPFSELGCYSRGITYTSYVANLPLTFYLLEKPCASYASYYSEERATDLYAPRSEIGYLGIVLVRPLDFYREHSVLDEDYPLMPYDISMPRGLEIEGSFVPEMDDYSLQFKQELSFHVTSLIPDSCNDIVLPLYTIDYTEQVVKPEASNTNYPDFVDTIESSLMSKVQIELQTQQQIPEFTNPTIESLLIASSDVSVPLAYTPKYTSTFVEVETGNAGNYAPLVNTLEQSIMPLQQEALSTLLGYQQLSIDQLLLTTTRDILLPSHTEDKIVTTEISLDYPIYADHVNLIEQPLMPQTQLYTQQQETQTKLSEDLNLTLDLFVNSSTSQDVIIPEYTPVVNKLVSNNPAFTDVYSTLTNAINLMLPLELQIQAQVLTSNQIPIEWLLPRSSDGLLLLYVTDSTTPIVETDLSVMPHPDISQMVKIISQPELYTQPLLYGLTNPRIEQSHIVFDSTMVPLVYIPEYATRPFVEAENGNAGSYSDLVKVVEQPVMAAEAKLQTQQTKHLNMDYTVLPVHANKFVTPSTNYYDSNILDLEPNTSAEYETPSIQVRDYISLHPEVQPFSENIESTEVSTLPSARDSIQPRFQPLNKAAFDTDLTTDFDFRSIAQDASQLDLGFDYDVDSTNNTISNTLVNTASAFTDLDLEVNSKSSPLEDYNSKAVYEGASSESKRVEPLKNQEKTQPCPVRPYSELSHATRLDAMLGTASAFTGLELEVNDSLEQRSDIKVEIEHKLQNRGYIGLTHNPKTYICFQEGDMHKLSNKLNNENGILYKAVSDINKKRGLQVADIESIVALYREGDKKIDADIAKVGISGLTSDMKNRFEMWIATNDGMLVNVSVYRCGGVNFAYYHLGRGVDKGKIMQMSHDEAKEAYNLQDHLILYKAA